MSDERKQIAQRLHHQIDQERAALGTLLETLQEEADALRDPLAQPLETISRRKAEQLDALKALESRREALFDALKLDGDPRRVCDYIRHELGDPGLANHWNGLLALAAECQQLNRLNGATIELGQLRLRQALSLLRGTQPDQPAYTRQGRRQSTSAGRLLGQA